MKKLYNLILVVFITTITFSSCSKSEHLSLVEDEISKTIYTPAFYKVDGVNETYVINFLTATNFSFENVEGVFKDNLIKIDHISHFTSSCIPQKLLIIKLRDGNVEPFDITIKYEGVYKKYRIKALGQVGNYDKEKYKNCKDFKQWNGEIGLP